jgi:hypothetical protein
MMLQALGRCRLLLFFVRGSLENFVLTGFEPGAEA